MICNMHCIPDLQCASDFPAWHLVHAVTSSISQARHSALQAEKNMQALLLVIDRIHNWHTCFTVCTWLSSFTSCAFSFILNVTGNTFFAYLASWKQTCRYNWVNNKCPMVWYPFHSLCQIVQVDMLCIWFHH